MARIFDSVEEVFEYLKKHLGIIPDTIESKGDQSDIKNMSDALRLKESKDKTKIEKWYGPQLAYSCMDQNSEEIIFTILHLQTIQGYDPGRMICVIVNNRGLSKAL